MCQSVRLAQITRCTRSTQHTTPPDNRMTHIRPAIASTPKAIYDLPAYGRRACARVRIALRMHKTPSFKRNTIRRKCAPAPLQYINVACTREMGPLSTPPCTSRPRIPRTRLSANKLTRACECECEQKHFDCTPKPQRRRAGGVFAKCNHSSPGTTAPPQ